MAGMMAYPMYKYMLEYKFPNYFKGNALNRRDEERLILIVTLALSLFYASEESKIV